MARPKSERSDYGNVERVFIDAQEARFSGLKLFAEQLRSPQVIEQVRRDDHLFSTALRLAFEEYGVKQSEISKLLELSDGVLSRWASKKNLPAPLSRGPVIEAIAGVIHDGIARQKAMSLTLPSGRVVN